MEANLTFNETLTVEQFKAQMNVSRIDVKQNPKTNKLFFTYGAKTGAVAVKGIPQHPMVSLNPCFSGTYSRRATFATSTISMHYAPKNGT